MLYDLHIHIEKVPDLGSLTLNQTPKKLGFGTLHMGAVYEIPPELAAKYIPPNRLDRGCGPWVKALGQEPVTKQGAYLKPRGYLSIFWAIFEIFRKYFCGAFELLMQRNGQKNATKNRRKKVKKNAASSGTCR
jgi:hypothetical protein